MAQKKIMIVDDSGMMRTILFNMLCKDPDLLIVGAVENGKKALEQLPTMQPDLILLDLEMPEMNGLEFLRRVRFKTHAKVVVLSSLIGDDAKAAEAVSLGAHAVISKPSGSVSYDLKAARGNEIFATIHRLLGMSAPAQVTA
jgi:two-component system chemotaxis response regulator CheB